VRHLKHLAQLSARGSPYFSSLLLGKMRAPSPAVALTASSGAIPAEVDQLVRGALRRVQEATGRVVEWLGDEYLDFVTHGSRT
jgi:hypothetical protein